MKKCHHQDPSLCHLWPDAELSPMSCEMTLCACSTTGPDTRTLRVFDPPKPVVVDIAIAAPSCGRSYAAGGGVSLRVRASGARIEPTMNALLLAWLQTSNGLWRGICQMPVESANRVSSATITMWVPPEALQPRQDAAER